MLSLGMINNNNKKTDISDIRRIILSKIIVQNEQILLEMLL